MRAPDRPSRHSMQQRSAGQLSWWPAVAASCMCHTVNALFPARATLLHMQPHNATSLTEHAHAPIATGTCPSARLRSWRGRFGLSRTRQQQQRQGQGQGRQGRRARAWRTRPRPSWSAAALQSPGWSLRWGTACMRWRGCGMHARALCPLSCQHERWRQAALELHHDAPQPRRLQFPPHHHCMRVAHSLATKPSRAACGSLTVSPHNHCVPHGCRLPTTSYTPSASTRTTRTATCSCACSQARVGRVVTLQAAALCVGAPAYAKRRQRSTNRMSVQHKHAMRHAMQSTPQRTQCNAQAMWRRRCARSSRRWRES